MDINQPLYLDELWFQWYIYIIATLYGIAEFTMPLVISLGNLTR